MRWSSVGCLVLVVWVSGGSAAFGASYQLTDGTIVDPIRSVRDGTPHPYSGTDLAPGVDLQDAGLGGADLREAALAGADLRRAGLVGTDFRGADLSNADLREAAGTIISLEGANLSGAQLSGMTGFSFRMTGANVRGATWVDSVADEARLSGADFSFADLRGWNASEANIRGASFVQANLDGASLEVFATDADFSLSTLRGVSIAYIDDTPTTLRGASFRQADLSDASFYAYIVGGGLFVGRIDVDDTDFSGAILANAVGLGNTIGAALYDANTDFTHAWSDLDATIPFDPIAAGWTLIPEPGTELLMGLGLVGLAAGRKAGRQSR